MVDQISTIDVYTLVRSLLTADGIGRYAKGESLLALVRAVAANPCLASNIDVAVEKSNYGRYPVDKR